MLELASKNQKPISKRNGHNAPSPGLLLTHTETQKEDASYLTRWLSKVVTMFTETSKSYLATAPNSIWMTAHVSQ